MRSATILIVEDEVSIRNLMVMMLAHAGYLVLEADSADEALEISTTFEDAIDLLIADHSLKTMTGREVAEKLSQSRSRLKVLHMSGYSLEMLQEEGETISGPNFLAKPFTSAQLIRKVAEILGSADENYLPRIVSSIH